MHKTELITKLDNSLSLEQILEISKSDKLEIISFKNLGGEIGIHLILKPSLSSVLLQDVFVVTSYENAVEYRIVDNIDGLFIEIKEVNEYEQIEKCVIFGGKKQIESFLIADGNATPNNSINFGLLNYSNELQNIISRLEIIIDELNEKTKGTEI